MGTDNIIKLIDDLAAAVGGDINSLNAAMAAVDTEVGDLTQLATSAKSSLVSALNELKSQVGNIDITALINDNITASSSTWSSDKVKTQIDVAVDALVNGAPGAMDTLKELAAEITGNEGVLNQLLATQAKRVAVDKTQNFTDGEKGQARANIGAASDADHSALSNRVGDVSTANPVAIYNAAKD